MISRQRVNMIYAKTDSTVKNREYAFTETFESVFEEDTFFNSCLLERDWQQVQPRGNKLSLGRQFAVVCRDLNHVTQYVTQYGTLCPDHSRLLKKLCRWDRAVVLYIMDRR